MNNFEEEKAEWLEDYLDRRNKRRALFDGLEMVDDIDGRSAILDEIMELDDVVCLHNRGIWKDCFSCDLIEYALRKEGKIGDNYPEDFDNWVANMREVDPDHIEWLEEEYGKQRSETEAAAKKS